MKANPSQSLQSIGSELEDDFGPPRIRSSPPGSAYFRPEKGVNRLDMEANVQDVSVFNPVLLAFQPEEPFFADAFF